MYNANNPFATPPVVKNLLLINLVAFVAVWAIPAFNQLMGAYGALHWFGSPYFRSWQFVTYMFLHGGVSHLFFNMFALWMFGRTLEYALGRRRFLVYYLVCGVGAALLQMLVATLTGEFGLQLIGASGAVMGLLAAFGIMWPETDFYIYFIPIPVKAKWVVLGYAAIELFLGTSGRQAGVAHFAHIGGMLWGTLLLWWWRRRGAIRF